jgi:hypothetical protein
VQYMMKKKIIVAVALLFGITLAFLAGFIAGGTQQARVSANSGILFDSAVLKLLDAGVTNRACQILETKLISQLNWHDTLSNNVLHIRAAALKGPSGPRWESELQWATTRVRIKRDDRNYLMSHPEEASKRFAEAFEKGLRESGKSNVNVRVTGGSKDSIEMKLDNY